MYGESFLENPGKNQWADRTLTLFGFHRFRLSIVLRLDSAICPSRTSPDLKIPFAIL